MRYRRASRNCIELDLDFVVKKKTYRILIYSTCMNSRKIMSNRIWRRTSLREISSLHFCSGRWVEMKTGDYRRLDYISKGLMSMLLNVYGVSPEEIKNLRKELGLS